MDSLTSLRVLATVAELKSFSAAADRLGLSPAMASKHVKHAEARVGARLLNRNSRNVSLTEAGARYLETVRPMLEGLDETESQLSADTQAPRGVLKISMPVWMANPGFVGLLARYHAAYPQVSFDLDLSSGKINLVEEGVDLALRVAFSLDEGLIARKLAQVAFQFVAAPDFLDRAGRPSRPEDLAGAPLLAYSGVVADGRIRSGGASGFDVQMRPVIVSGNETFLHLAAVAGMGFAILPGFQTRDDLAAGRLEVVLPAFAPPPFDMYAIYADRSYLPAKMRSFLDFLAGADGLGSVMPGDGGTISSGRS